MTTDKKNILVIEDADCMKFVLCHTLGKTHNVITKADGYAAMAWMRRGNMPDAIILDIELPYLGGKEFLAGLRCSGYFRNVPVIVLSGCEDQEKISAIKELEVAQVIKKPFNPNEIKQAVSDATLTPQLAFV